MKLSHVARLLLSRPWIDWGEMPSELQSQRPSLGPGAVRSPMRIKLPPASASANCEDPTE